MTTAPLTPAHPAWLDRPEAYSGVRTRRILAFLIDYALVLLLCVPIGIVILVLGLLTLGIGWMLFAILFPIVAIPYVAFTLGGAAQATPGMRMMDLRLERTDGERVEPVIGLAHSVLFWVANAVTSGAILLLGLFTPRKQLIQDLLLRTVVVRASAV